MAFNRAKNCQRVLQKDPEVINAWFKRVRTTINKYSVQPENIHNFNETGFQIGVIGSIKMVTGLERRIRPTLIQLGNQKQVTIIQGIYATGYAIPPFIIYKDRVHLLVQYEKASIPSNWKFTVSKNGQINNNLSLKWLKYFNAYTKLLKQKKCIDF